jgi:hypothetical protein
VLEPPIWGFTDISFSGALSHRFDDSPGVGPRYLGGCCLLLSGRILPYGGRSGHSNALDELKSPERVRFRVRNRYGSRRNLRLVSVAKERGVLGQILGKPTNYRNLSQQKRLIRAKALYRRVLHSRPVSSNLRSIDFQLV